jgi:AraC family transcriptional regulator
MPAVSQKSLPAPEPLLLKYKARLARIAAYDSGDGQSLHPRNGFGTQAACSPVTFTAEFMRAVYLPLPLNESDRVRSAAVEGFIFTEAKHAPLTFFPRHAHERANLTVLLGGVFDESYGSRVESCSRHSLLCRPVGEKHSDRIGRTGAHNLSMEIESARLHAIGRHTDMLGRVWQWRDARALLVARRICRELRMKDAAAPLALESLALELLALVARRPLALTRSQSAPPWLRAVRDVLHDRFQEHLSVGELAASAEVHPVYLARAFRAHFRCTPGIYLRRLRLEWAARQLAASERPLSEIAQAAGFFDQSHFTRMFKQETGTTPARFRCQTSAGKFRRVYN